MFTSVKYTVQEKKPEIICEIDYVRFGWFVKICDDGITMICEICSFLSPRYQGDLIR